jgi:hypothetical protein
MKGWPLAGGKEVVTPLRKWAFAILIDALLFASFYAWLALGMQGARNIVVFAGYFFGITGALAGLVADKTTMTSNDRSAAYDAYQAVTDTALVACFVWSGLLLCGTLYALASLLIRGARKREPKAVTPSGINLSEHVHQGVEQGHTGAPL